MVQKKKRTSISPNQALWNVWSMYVHEKTGNSKKVTAETEKAIMEYMRKYPLKK
jgi:hypothetical protein